MPFNRITATAITLFGLHEAYIIYSYVSEGRKREQRHANIRYYRRMHQLTSTWMRSEYQQSRADRLKYGRIPKPQELVEYHRSIGIAEE